MREGGREYFQTYYGTYYVPDILATLRMPSDLIFMNTPQGGIITVLYMKRPSLKEVKLTASYSPLTPTNPYHWQVTKPRLGLHWSQVSDEKKGKYLSAMKIFQGVHIEPICSQAFSICL